MNASLRNKTTILLTLLLSLAVGNLFGQESYSLEPTPASLDMGYRPNGCWASDFSIRIWNTGAKTDVTSITCDNDYFQISGPTTPFFMSSRVIKYFNVSTTGVASGLQTGNITFVYGNNQTLVVPVSAYAYDPVAPDVWELPLAISTYPYAETMNTANLHNNYTLPTGITDGKDAVFQMTFDNQTCLSAKVSSCENGKLALYNEDLGGQPAPGNNNAIVIGTNILKKYDFENGVLDGSEWTNDNTHPWEISRREAQGGCYSLRTTKSETFSNTSTIEMSYTAPTDGVISFYWRVVYENWGCIGHFYIDNVEQGSWRNNYWQKQEYPITEGEHVFKWVMEYKQNCYQNAYYYIDNIEIYNEESIVSNSFLLPGTYYLVTSSTSENYHVNIDANTPPVPTVASNPKPSNNENCYDINNLTWEFGDYTNEYQVLFGETNPPTEVLVDWTNNLTNSQTVNTEAGKTYYWRINERNDTGETLGEVWSFTYLGNITPDDNNIVYVALNGTGNGSSWENACPNLQAAIDGVAEMGDNKPVIWVAKGTYLTNGVYQTGNNKTCCFFGHDGVKLYGGFNGDEPANYDLSLRNLEANATILDAENQCFVVISQASEWDGFVMQHGGDGGYYSYGGTSMLQHCKILYSEGSGVSYYSGELMCYHNQVSYHAQDGITMVSNNIHGPDIRDCVVSFNKRNGIYSYSCVRCQICNNGNGFSLTSSRGGTMIGCLVANNDGFGASCEYIVNSTIVNNGTGLARIHYSKKLVLCNSIIWGNAQQLEASIWSDFYSSTIANNAIQGGIEDKNGVYRCIKLDGVNVSNGVQPGFVHPSSGIGSRYTDGDWRLLNSSPCINMGIDNMEDFTNLTTAISYLDIDFAGNQRVQQGRIDLGAWESPYEKPNYLYSIRPDANNIIYVKADGQGDGSSWANATSNLQNAVEISVLYEPVPTIWVAQGTYTLSNFPLQVKEQLRMYGGFEGTESPYYDLNLRDLASHASVLNGSNTRRVLNQMSALSATKSAVIDGFVLRNGTADNGAGAYLLNNMTLSNCTLDHNTATNKGGGIYAENATLKNCVVMNNIAQNGGGIYANNSQIVQSLVNNNQATAQGGGLYLNNSDLFQNVVVKNQGGGLAINADNNNAHVRMTNSIIWGNQNSNITYLTNAAQANTTLSHCAVENFTNHEQGNIPLSSNNTAIFGPNFVNPVETVGLTENQGDWHLEAISPCINTGSNTLPGTTLPDFDLNSQPRIYQESTVDMGVYEYQSATQPTTIEYINASILPGEVYDFFGTPLSASGTYEHSYTENGIRHLVYLKLQLPDVTYVSENGAGTMDGSSWANALDGNTALESGYTKLAEAIQNATSNSCFWVANGTYHCSNSDASKHFVLTEGVRIYGGFAGNETTIEGRNLENAATMFSGEFQHDNTTTNNTDGIFIAPDATTVWNESAYLDGITITQGYNSSNKGAALWVGEGTMISINQCKIIQNWEGCIYNSGVLDVKNSDFSNNRKENLGPQDNLFFPDYTGYARRGAGVLFNVEQGIASFNNCNFESNFSENNGVAFNEGLLKVNGSLFDDNTADQFATIFSKGKVKLTNTVFNNNRAINRIGVMMILDSLELVNCTLSNNHSNYYTTLNTPNGTYGSYSGYRTSGIEAWGYCYVDSCQFLNNDAGAGNCLGGALSIMGTAEMKNSTFIGNKGNHPWVNPNSGGGIGTLPVYSSADGGALYVGGTATVTDCVFSENTGAYGSSIGVDGSLTMERCKIVNSIPSIGNYGTIKVMGNLTIKNSLLANNHDGILIQGNGVHSRFINSTIVNTDATLFMFVINTNEGIIDLDNCIVAGYSQWCNYTLNDNLTINTTNTLVTQDITNPMFVNPTTVLGYDENLDPLDANWTLQLGSPCINTGDVTLLNPDPLAVDLGGNLRVKNNQIDMGAYEYGTTYMFINPGNWSEASNWSGNAIPGTTDEAFIKAACQLNEDVTISSIAVDQNQTITVQPGKTLNVTGTLTNSNASSVVIEDGAQLVYNNMVNATLKKVIAAHGSEEGWYFIASPVNTATAPSAIGHLISPTTANYDLYLYDEPDHYWRNYKPGENSQNSGFNIEPLKGYLYANALYTTLSMEGNMNAADATLSTELSYQSNNNNLLGYNLVGNPFTHNLNSGEIQLGGTDLTAYYMMENGSEIVAQQISTDPIKPGQGFMVQATDDEQQLVFHPSRKGRGNKAGYIRIAATSGTFTDMAYIQLQEGNTLQKMSLSDKMHKVFVQQGSDDYAALTIEATAGEIPVGFEAAQNGEYTLLINPEGVEMAYLHLIDNMTGADIDLLALRQAQGPASYTFRAKTSDYASRFRLVFATKGADYPSTCSETFAFVNNGNIIVNGDGVLQIVDVMGRVLLCRDAKSCVSTSGMTPGLYVLRLINGNEVKTQKIVID